MQIPGDMAAPNCSQLFRETLHGLLYFESWQCDNDSTQYDQIFVNFANVFVGRNTEKFAKADTTFLFCYMTRNCK